MTGLQAKRDVDADLPRHDNGGARRAFDWPVDVIQLFNVRLRTEHSSQWAAGEKVNVEMRHLLAAVFAHVGE